MQTKLKEILEKSSSVDILDNLSQMLLRGRKPTKVKDLLIPLIVEEKLNRYETEERQD